MAVTPVDKLDDFHVTNLFYVRACLDHNMYHVLQTLEARKKWTKGKPLLKYIMMGLEGPLKKVVRNRKENWSLNVGAKTISGRHIEIEDELMLHAGGQTDVAKGTKKAKPKDSTTKGTKGKENKGTGKTDQKRNRPESPIEISEDELDDSTLQRRRIKDKINAEGKWLSPSHFGH